MVLLLHIPFNFKFNLKCWNILANLNKIKLFWMYTIHEYNFLSICLKVVVFLHILNRHVNEFVLIKKICFRIWKVIYYTSIDKYMVDKIPLTLITLMEFILCWTLNTYTKRIECCCIKDTILIQRVLHWYVTLS